MTKESTKPGKYAAVRASYKGTTLHDHIGVPISGAASKSIKSLHEKGFHVLGKEDIKKELDRTNELYGMTPEKFYRAWKNDEIHGFHATKLGCLYEFYRDEYE